MEKRAMRPPDDTLPYKVTQIPENKTINNAYGKPVESGINIIASQASALDAGVTERGAKEGFYFNANVLYNMGGGSLAVYQEYENDSDDDSIIYIKTTMTIRDSTGSIIGQGRKRISYLKKHGDEYKFTGEALTLNRAAYGGWQDCLDRYDSLKNVSSITQAYGNILVDFMLEKWIGDAYITLVLRLGQRGAGQIGKCIHINKLNNELVGDFEAEYTEALGLKDDDSDTVNIQDIDFETPTENIIELTNDRLAYGFFAYMSLLFPTDGIVGALLNSGIGHAMMYDNSSDSDDKTMYIYAPGRIFQYPISIMPTISDEPEKLGKRQSPREYGQFTSSMERKEPPQRTDDRNHKTEQAYYAVLEDEAKKGFTDSDSEGESEMTNGGKRRKRHSNKAKRTHRVRKS